MIYDHIQNENQGRKPNKEDDNIIIMKILIVTAIILTIIYLKNT